MFWSFPSYNHVGRNAMTVGAGYTRNCRGQPKSSPSPDTSISTLSALPGNSGVTTISSFLASPKNAAGTTAPTRVPAWWNEKRTCGGESSGTAEKSPASRRRVPPVAKPLLGETPFAL